MKKALLLFVLSLSILSCSSDDDNNSLNNSNQSLAGSWELSGFEATNTTSFVIDLSLIHI